jgi:hypothetical protein
VPLIVLAATDHDMPPQLERLWQETRNTGQQVFVAPANPSIPEAVAVAWAHGVSNL